ncbi:MAG: hypothetical protein Q9203_005034 [Teloschistes exilis]
MHPTCPPYLPDGTITARSEDLHLASDMLLHSYTLLGICCFLCVPFVSSIITCENGAGTSPLLADCYAALSQISDTDDLVGVLRNSAYALDAGSFVSKTCSIIVSDYTPAGMKAIDPNAVIKWTQLRSETSLAISTCATTDQNVITGAVIIVGPSNPMALAHYIVRVGNEGFSNSTSAMAPTHWHYLSPQRLWGLPKAMPHVKVRAQFMKDINDLRVTTYIWFLCNGHNGPGHFVQVGIGAPHSGYGPMATDERPIPADVMTRLRQGFDHWFNWVSVCDEQRFQERLREIPAPVPTFIPTLRRVAREHPSLPAFEALLGDQTLQQPRRLSDVSSSRQKADYVWIVETDLENLRKEQIEPSSEGFVYLIHMEGTTFYKIGMSLDPRTRLGTLQTGNPYLLAMRKTQAVPDMRKAESGLHQQFGAHRMLDTNATEWFDFEDGTASVEAAFDVLVAKGSSKAGNESQQPFKGSRISSKAQRSMTPSPTT